MIVIFLLLWQQIAHTCIICIRNVAAFRDIQYAHSAEVFNSLWFGKPVIKHYASKILLLNTETVDVVMPTTMCTENKLSFVVLD